MALSAPLSDNLTLCSTSASDFSEAWSSSKDALSAVSGESLDDSESHVPADSSGLLS